MSKSSQATMRSLQPGQWYTFVIFAYDFKGRSETSGSIPLSIQTSKFWLFEELKKKVYR